MAIVGFADAEAFQLAGLVASPLIAASFEDLERPWDEIDLTVIDGHFNGAPWGIPALHRTSSELGNIDAEHWGFGGSRVSVHKTDAVEIHVPDLEPDELQDEAERLVDTYPVRKGCTHFQMTGFEWDRIFLTNQRGEVLVGEYSRGIDCPSWVLPEHAGDLKSWLRLFLQRVNEVSPTRVPNPPASWSSWDTAEQADLRRERTAVTLQTNEALAELQEQLTEIDQRLEVARELAESSVGRLLTSDGNDLKESVAEAFGEFGFDVTDVDAKLSNGQGKREDLWVEVSSSAGEIVSQKSRDI